MMDNNKILNAQDIFNVGGEYGAGFNMRVSGYDYQEANGYPSFPSQDRVAGWLKADNMIEKGQIYYFHRFKHLGCDGYAFPYGGTFVCNTCGCRDIQKPWMAVKVEQDGNAFCCKGTPFENLQESDNYAFGDTREDALKNYEKLMHDSILELTTTA